ncbi:MAG TPA: metalloregulator ArsR/SmtB family transcription factor [Acidimicrobiales bacterium]
MTDRPLDPLFDALADGTRRRVLASLVEHGNATATQLAGRFPVTRQAISKHLQVLLDAGVVTAERRGRETHFAFVPGSLAAIRGWVDGLDAAGAEGWQDGVAAWQRHLEAQRARRGLAGPVRAAATRRPRPPRA